MSTLNEIDCNCNSCKYLERSFTNRQRHEDFHYNMQKNLFNIKRIKLLERVEYYFRKIENESNVTQKKVLKKKTKSIIKESKELKFYYDNSSTSLHFGHCILKNEDISFIPNICQLNTQECYKPR